MVEVSAQPNMTIVLPVPIELLAGGPSAAAGGTAPALGQIAASAAAALAKNLGSGDKPQQQLPPASAGSNLQAAQLESSSKVPR
jgi:hypothetical protein